MSGGTFNVSREIWDDPDFADEPFTEREAWLWLVSEASWKPRARRIGKTVVNTERGQLAASVRFLAEGWKWSKSRVHRFLKRRESANAIRIETGTGVIVITLCNYDKFQGARDSGGTEAGQQRDKREEGGNKDNTSQKASPSSRGARLPAEWVLPRDWGQWAVAEGMTAEAVRREAEKFRDYWHSVAGAKGRKADWQATWRNWIRRALSQQPKPQPKRNSADERHAARMRAAARFSGVDSGPDWNAVGPLLPAGRDAPDFGGGYDGLDTDFEMFAQGGNLRLVR